MTKQYDLEQLRVDVPTLEPDAVLLAQLVELSSASAPAATSSRATSMKVLLAAAGVAVVATTTWAAGAVPGKLFPPHPASHPHTVVPPTETPSPLGPTATRTPGASHPPAEAPGLPGRASGRPDGRPTGRSAGPSGPGAVPSVPSLFAGPEHEPYHGEGREHPEDGAPGNSAGHRQDGQHRHAEQHGGHHPPTLPGPGSSGPGRSDDHPDPAATDGHEDHGHRGEHGRGPDDSDPGHGRSHAGSDDPDTASHGEESGSP